VNGSSFFVFKAESPPFISASFSAKSRQFDQTVSNLLIRSKSIIVIADNLEVVSNVLNVQFKSLKNKITTYYLVPNRVLSSFVHNLSLEIFFTEVKLAEGVHPADINVVG